MSAPVVEHTARVDRVIEVVRGRGDVTVVGHPCPWRDDLVELLTEQLPGQSVTAQESVPAAGPSVLLAVSQGDAFFEQLLEERRTGASPSPGAEAPRFGWTAGRRDPEDVPPPESLWDEELGARVDVDVVLVPVSGVRPPRRLVVSWGDPAGGLWDEQNRVLFELGDLLDLPDDVRVDLRRAVDARTSQPPDLVERLQAAVGPEFEVLDGATPPS